MASRDRVGITWLPLRSCQSTFDDCGWASKIAQTFCGKNSPRGGSETAMTVVPTDVVSPYRLTETAARAVFGLRCCINRLTASWFDSSWYFRPQSSEQNSVEFRSFLRSAISTPHCRQRIRCLSLWDNSNGTRVFEPDGKLPISDCAERDFLAGSKGFSWVPLDRRKETKYLSILPPGLKYLPIPTMDSLIEPVNWFEEFENG